MSNRRNIVGFRTNFQSEVNVIEIENTKNVENETEDPCRM